jgi:hypothetical protein
VHIGKCSISELWAAIFFWIHSIWILILLHFSHHQITNDLHKHQIQVFCVCVCGTGDWNQVLVMLVKCSAIEQASQPQQSFFSPHFIFFISISSIWIDSWSQNQVSRCYTYLLLLLSFWSLLCWILLTLEDEGLEPLSIGSTSWVLTHPLFFFLETESFYFEAGSHYIPQAGL